MLYITEKPSQIAPLKAALKKANLDNNISIVALAGHILRLYNFQEYDKSMDDQWYNLVINNKIPFFPKEIKKRVKVKSSFMMKNKKITSDYQKKFKDVQEQINRADKIILAPDPDNEGATLAMEVIQKANALNKVIGMINMSKLDITSLTREVKITNKLNYNAMFAAGEARAYYDQVFGFNATIAATIFLGKGQLLQIGGVKLPTIKMVVMRDEEIDKHTESFYYTIKAIGVKDNIEFPINIYTKDNKEKKYDNYKQAQDIFNQISHDGKSQGTITLFTEKEKLSAPPKPYSLTDLQAISNKKLKLKAKDTLLIAQKLYIDYKIQSYPRTDSNYYSEGEYQNAPSTLQILSKIEEYNKYIQTINLSNLPKRKIFNDNKIDAHTALSPTQEITNEKYAILSDNEVGIFNLVVTRYIIQFMKDYKSLELKAQGLIKDDILFDFSESVTLDIGYKITENFKPTKRTIPSFQNNDPIQIKNIEIVKTKTKPKPRFTEASLLQAMEKIYRFFDDEEIKKQLGEKGIGTPATRASILEDLKTARKGQEPYLKLDKNKLISTNKARELIKTLPNKISSPILRANMENSLKQIEKGNIEKEAYLRQVKIQVTKIIEEIKSVGQLPEEPKPKQEDLKTELKCPLCSNPLVYNDIVFKCSSAKYQNGKATGCKFTIFRHQKLLKVRLDEKHIKRLLEGDMLTAPNGNKISLDLKSKYFTKIDFAQQKTPKDTLVETTKTYRYNDRYCFKDFNHKKLTKSEAKKLLKGETIKIKRKSKNNKEYEAYLTLNSEAKFEMSFAK